MTSAARPPRPSRVTIVTVLLWIGAVISVAAGVWLLVEAGDPATITAYGGTAAGVRSAGYLQLLVGLFMALVARGIGRGSQFARFLVSLVMVLRIVGDVFVASQYGSRFFPAVAVSVVWSLLVLAMLWNSRASRFFSPA